MAEKILEIKHLKKSYGQNEVLKDISLTVEKGEVISIIGSSGSGKSTFLRSINLLETPTAGEILYRGQNVLDPEYDLTHYREKLGMVFQSFNLFENLNVLENTIVAQTLPKQQFSSAKDLKQRRLPKKTLKKSVWDLNIGLPVRNNFQVVKSNGSPSHAPSLWILMPFSSMNQLLP